MSAAALAALAALAPPAAEDRLLYNHTPSAPVGFYLRIDGPIERGSFVTVRVRDVAPAAAIARGFDGPRDRFIKRVVALAGDRVCAQGDDLTINDGPRYERRSFDSTGAELPSWEACRALESDELLLLGDTAESFDGRYWGPVKIEIIEGVWRPLWRTRECARNTCDDLRQPLMQHKTDEGVGLDKERVALERTHLKCLRQIQGVKRRRRVSRTPRPPCSHPAARICDHVTIAGEQ